MSPLIVTHAPVRDRTPRALSCRARTFFFYFKVQAMRGSNDDDTPDSEQAMVRINLHTVRQLQPHEADTTVRRTRRSQLAVRASLP